jgi:ABC-type nickel/cobalt efflux system permease component RcnA
MNETAIFLVLLSAAMHALRNFLTKKEENRLVRIVSSIVIFLGAYLIAVAD